MALISKRIFKNESPLQLVGNGLGSGRARFIGTGEGWQLYQHGRPAISTGMGTAPAGRQWPWFLWCLVDRDGVKGGSYTGMGDRPSIQGWGPLQLVGNGLGSCGA
nr:hypothetical protein [Cytophagales bacterium]